MLLDPVDKPRDDILCKINGNLVDKIWHNQPLEPNSKIYLHDIKFAGVSHNDKISRCRVSLNVIPAKAGIQNTTKAF